MSLTIEIKEPGEHGCNCPLAAGDPEKEGTWCILGLDLHDKSFFSIARPGPDCPGPGVYVLTKCEEQGQREKIDNITAEEIMIYAFRKIQAHVDPNNAAYMKAWRIAEDMILLFGTDSCEPEIKELYLRKRAEIMERYTTAIKSIVKEEPA